MRLSVILLFIQLWGNVDAVSSQNACSALPDVPNASISEDTQKTEYQGGHVILYTCDPGYTASGPVIKYVCSSEGWLAVQQGTCSSTVGCVSPPPLADGDVKHTLKSEYSHDERVEYVCQSYYTMEGEPYRTCINGEWIGQMRCRKPCTVNDDDMRQNNITLKYGGHHKIYSTHNDYIEFRCTKGRPVGTMRQKCDDGVILLPSCKEVSLSGSDVTYQLS